MIDTAFEEQKISIIIEALILGLEIEYKQGWFIFFRNKELYQSYYKPGITPIIHKSSVGLGDFLKFIEKLPLDAIKRIYGDTRLIILQNKLIENNRKNEE